MRTQNLDLEGPAGRLEAVLMTPEGEPAASAILCHAHPLHGGSMHFKLLFRVAKVLQSRGYSVLRFHFRGVGRSEGVFDEGRGEAEDARAAIAALGRLVPGKPMLLGGFSFGAGVALHVGALEEKVSALLLLGLPISAFGAPQPENPLEKPILLIQGERDQYGRREAIESFARSLEGPVELSIVSEADHFFEGRLGDVERAVNDWLSRGPDELP